MRFRSTVLGLLLGLALAASARASGPDVVLLSAVTTTGASTTSLTASGSVPEDLVWVQSSGSYGVGTTVKIQASRDGTTWSDTATLATGEMWFGPVCECLLRANVTVHEGGGKTVTVRAWIAGRGSAVAQ